MQLSLRSPGSTFEFALANKPIGEELALSGSAAHRSGWPKDMAVEMHQVAWSSSDRKMVIVNVELFPYEGHIGMPTALLHPTFSMHSIASKPTFRSGMFVGALCK